MGQSRAVTQCPNYVYMFEDHNLVAKFHRITRLNLLQGMQGVMTETANGLVTGFVAIPSVIFFPLYIMPILSSISQTIGPKNVASCGVTSMIIFQIFL